MKCPLSEFITRGYIYYTLKWSKGLQKILHLGADEVYKVKTLSFKVNPRLPVGRWNLIVDEDKAIFQQSSEGDIELKILDDISVKCSESIDIESNFYIQSEFSRYLGKGITKKYERYIKFSRIKNKERNEEKNYE